MKKFILLVVIAALSSMHLCGQTTPPAGTPYMEFNVARNSIFQFKLMGHSKNTDVWVSTSATNYEHQTISDDWSDYQTVNAKKIPTTVKVKIYGAIKAIDAGLKTTNEGNKLSLIDVTKNPSLKALSCYGAGIRTLNISENSELTVLECSNNRLTNLDVSQNNKLEGFSCANNQLLLLNVANGKNNKLSSFDASGNPSLTCIQVDDGFTPPANWKKDATAQWNNDSANPCPNNYQISFSTTKAVGETISLKIDAAIDDQANVWIDLNNNGSKDDGEAITAFSNHLGTGIDYVLGAKEITLYGKINSFVCSNNALSSLDISKNTLLTFFDCSNNQISSLDVSKNSKLTMLICRSNTLTSLDVTNITNLRSLYFSNNQLTSIDVSQNKVLRELLCDNNQLTSLDVSQNTELYRFQCFSNQLTSLDISQNKKLAQVDCYSNQLTSLDISQNTALSNLYCYSNQLKTLDVSKNTKLIRLHCYNNQLTSLNVANGNNDNVTTFNATNNPDLTCIQVDDGFIPSDTWKKDAAAEWNNDSANPCVPIVVGINDLILNRVKIYPNPAKETLYILSDVEVLEVELFNIEGRLILKQNHSDAISIGHLPGGIYQVVIFTDNGVYTEKMIKQ